MDVREEIDVSNPVVWFEVIGQDGDRLRRFYGQLLGWRFRPDSRTSAVLQREDGGPGIGARVGQAGLGHPAWLTFYAQVADVEASVARAKALGSRVLMAPTRVRDATLAVVSDPEGHPVGLWQPA